MSKVRNPYYVDPLAAWAEARKAAFDAWLQEPAQAALRDVPFDAIRAAFPNEPDPITGEAPLSDGSIHAVLRLLGYEVVS
jgi:hypothetical protein